MNSNLDFTFRDPEIPISKELIMSAYPQETYMEFYVGRPVDRRSFCSPFRKDNHPSCAFYRNKKGDVIFKDFATGFSGNFISVVMEKYKCDYVTALRTIYNDFNLISRKDIVVNPVLLQPTKPSKIGVKIRDFTEQDLKWWGEYGITRSILDKYNVYSCEAIFLNDMLHKIIEHRLAFGYYGGKDSNGELWRIYYPQEKEFRFLTNWPKSKIQGWDQLPAEGKLLVITKSMKDVMVFDSFGIPACAPNSELFFLNSEQVESVRKRFKHIVLLWDNDRTGYRSLVKLRREYPDFVCTVIPQMYGAKDISDFVKLWGREQTKMLFKDFIKSYIEKES